MDNTWSHGLGFYWSWSEAQKGAEDMGQIKALVGGLPVREATLWPPVLVVCISFAADFPPEKKIGCVYQWLGHPPLYKWVSAVSIFGPHQLGLSCFLYKMVSAVQFRLFEPSPKGTMWGGNKRALEVSWYF